jgi:putative phosphoribosyl transferase
MLGEVLVKYKNEGPIVLAVPRGGVETGFEIAAVLEAPMDIIIARKLGAPGQPELAMGAVVDGDNPQTVLNDDVMSAFRVTQEYLDHTVEAELAEIDRRQKVYRRGHLPESVEGKTVILVDDGIATGASIRAAIRGLRRKPLKRLILAVPVAPPETVQLLQKEVDDLICLSAPASFMSVGSHYEEFEQTSDEKVIELLDRARAWATSR